jgi:molybdenum cofactor cytidylyltransferase
MPWCSVVHTFLAWRNYYTLPCNAPACEIILTIERCIIARMSLNLIRALRVECSSRIAFVGAGGKTTALFQLARELINEKAITTVVVTGTSHLGAWQIPLADLHIVAESTASLEENKYRLQGVVLVTGELGGDRTKPLNEETLNWLHQYCDKHSIPLLIEADGSRQKPLKAWSAHEPPIPSFVDQVVQVVGLTGLQQSLTDQYVHRPEIFSARSGLTIGERVTTDALISVLKHPKGGLKNIPAHAHRTILLNQADTPELQAIAHGLVQPLISIFHSVIICSLQQETVFAVHEPVAGIVLAAGESARFGNTKQLLDWKGEPFVRAVALTALEAGLSPVIVVTGANAEKVELVLENLNVIIVRNEDWKSGQGSSIKAGVSSLTSPPPGLPQIRHGDFGFQEIPSVGFGGGARRAEEVGAAVFLLTDQPQITTSILRALVQRHAESLSPVVAPMVMDQRANPVLFDRETFVDLVTLEGDVGGRAIFHKHRVEYLPWHDDRLLLDVDTPEMYERLIANDSL